MAAPKLWTKDFVIVSIENFFVYFTYYLLISIVAVYVTDHFHASPSLAGLSSGIFIIGAVLGRLYAGSSIVDVGRKKMLYAGFAFYIVTTLLYFLAHTLSVLIIIRFLQGAAFGIASTATGVIAAEIIPNERRGEGTGYYALSTTLAAAMGPFIGMFLIQNVNFNINLVVCAVALSLSFVAAFFLNVAKDESPKMDVKNAEGFSFNLNSFFEVKAMPISIITAITCFAYSSILSFIASYTKSINLITIGSFFFIVYAVAILVSRPFTGRWFDRKGENVVIYPALILFAAALIILGFSHQSFFILLAGVLTGLGYGNFFSSAQALTVKVSPQPRMALATSTFFIMSDVGIGIGPFILGFLIPLLGYRGLYFGMSIVVLANLFLYFFLYGRKASRKASRV